MLPEELLKEVQDELLDWQDQDMSILEVGHRSEAFRDLLSSAELHLRQLINIPDDYHVLFLGGAARTQFGMIPINFMNPEDSAGYIISGLWSNLAFQEAAKLKNAYKLSSAEDNNFVRLPDCTQYNIKKNSSYIYYTPNETVNGIQFHEIPDAAGERLIADMTSCLLTQPVDISKFALVFAGAQKNIANAGLTIVIIRDDLLSINPGSSLPTMMDYRVHAENKSLYATPPVFNCYIASKMFEWIKKQGGVEALYKVNCQKAEKLYSYIDASDFYQCQIEKGSRSIINIVFSLPNPALEEQFIKQAAKHQLYALKGHRVIGGIRASLYNSMPLEAVEKLIHFMREFSKEY